MGENTVWVSVPREPPEAMWGGLARQLVLWMRFGQPTGRALFQHLRSSGYAVPDWLRDEVEDADYVPPKGTMAVCIYKAMLDAAQDPVLSRDGRGGVSDVTESPATRVVRFTEAMRNRCREEDADILPLCRWCDELYVEWQRRGVSFDQAHRESLTAALARILTEYPDLPGASPSPLAAEGKSEGEP